ncbi:hypothetical protein EON64_02570 [archaeon]|nr:MAG: hypothetical protein EON64_02570 [archaeon]
MGSNNEYDFELDLFDRMPCEIHVFNCTVQAPTPPEKLTQSGRLFFHKLCIGSAEEHSRQSRRRRCISCSWFPCNQVERALHHRQGHGHCAAGAGAEGEDGRRRATCFPIGATTRTTRHAPRWCSWTCTPTDSTSPWTGAVETTPHWIRLRTT